MPQRLGYSLRCQVALREGFGVLSVRSDDKLMTILTGVVLTVALGAVAQKGDLFSDFGRSASFTLRDDVVTVAADQSYFIDVVANDDGATAADGRRLLITESPNCGSAYRKNGGVAYIAGVGCEGPQRLSYCIAEGDECPEAQVTVIVTASATPASASETPVALLSEAGEVTTAAVSAKRESGFKVESQPGGSLAALSSMPLGTLAPEEDAEAAETAPDATGDAVEDR